jgi:hypothetical protein
MRQDAPGGGVPLRGEQVAPVLADQPRAENSSDLGTARHLPELGEPARQQNREHAEAERELVDAKAAHIDAGTERVPFQTEHELRLGVDC